ncbi:hypothetical protein [Vibrio tasmaniensis]|uniref:hypothetical protein n=1 Tax=Vibrio tasmaniensis TaxID=212663 RepID=UPI00107F4C12|nr:hypothetical protein [Vibrio tasmaniensis]
MAILKVLLSGKVLKKNLLCKNKTIPVKIIKELIVDDLQIQNLDYLIVEVFRHIDIEYVGFNAYIISPEKLAKEYMRKFKSLTVNKLIYSRVLLTLPTVFDFIETADSIISDTVKEGYKDDENSISFALIKAPLRFLKYLEIKFEIPTKKNKLDELPFLGIMLRKITGKEETEYGDLALIVNMKNGMQGIAFYEAKLSKSDKSRIDEYSSLSSNQLEQYKGNEAFTQYLFYGIDKNNGQYYASCKPLQLVAHDFLDTSKPIESSCIEKSFASSFFDNLRGFGLNFDSKLVTKVKNGNVKFRYILEFDEMNDILQSKVYDLSIQNLNLNHNVIEN